MRPTPLPLVVLALFLLPAPRPAEAASFVDVPLEVRLLEAQVVVRGRVTAHVPLPENKALELARVKVEQVLKGGVQKGASLLVRSYAGHTTDDMRGQLGFPVGTQGVFVLRPWEEGRYQAPYPRDFQRPKEAGRIREMLRQLAALAWSRPVNGLSAAVIARSYPGRKPDLSRGLVVREPSGHDRAEVIVLLKADVPLALSTSPRCHPVEVSVVDPSDKARTLDLYAYYDEDPEARMPPDTEANLHTLDAGAIHPHRPGIVVKDVFGEKGPWTLRIVFRNNVPDAAGRALWTGRIELPPLTFTRAK